MVEWPWSYHSASCWEWDNENWSVTVAVTPLGDIETSRSISPVFFVLVYVRWCAADVQQMRPKCLLLDASGSIGCRGRIYWPRSYSKYYKPAVGYRKLFTGERCRAEQTERFIFLTPARRWPVYVSHVMVFVFSFHMLLMWLLALLRCALVACSRLLACSCRRTLNFFNWNFCYVNSSQTSYAVLDLDVAHSLHRVLKRL